MSANLRRMFPSSLKARLIIVLLLSAIIPMSLIGISSYYTIDLLLENKVEKGVQHNLEQEKKGLDTMLQNMDYASQQLLLFKELRDYYDEYSASPDPFKRAEIEKKVNGYTALVNYTNPDLGLMTYYLPEKSTYIFSSMNVRADGGLEQFPLLAKPNPSIKFHGPHHTLYPYSDNLVLSVFRLLESKPGETKIGVYIETNFIVFQEQLNKEPYGMPVSHLLLDQDDRILYSENEQLFPEGMNMNLKDLAGKKYAAAGSYYIFLSDTKKGWKLATAIQKSDFNRESKEWLIRFYSIALLSIGLSLLLAWLIWRMIYRPIVKLQQYIQNTATNRIQVPLKKSGVNEFDDLLATYSNMNKEIFDLLQEVSEKEHNKRKLEVEKLLYQINPHFIHNTLNTLQWLAKMNGQQEIFQLVSHFIEVLDYNLGKEGKVVTIRQEIKALQEYVALQQIRYQYAFRVDYEVDESVNDVPFLRFLLQPLVENAIYHGFRTKDGYVCVRITRDADEHILVQVEDNGEGISEEKMKQLFAEPGGVMKKVGFGIGLSFVQNTVKAYYGDQYRLEVTSEQGGGTLMSLRLPAEIGEEALD
ncbi:sensor histidine kinase [Paenibacillus silvisoli]|uniref:sensor histidine kinase n=1 Tax=Paenibacillus silvisoli TaxID=3110539 RepID=UPI002804E919|nr:histidine kinase [Paenibacillus silvisoli]